MTERSIDLNADLGEGTPGELELMPYLSSVNLACGEHAGDESLMHAAVREAARHGLAVGAHPGLADRANFGRVETTMAPADAAALVLRQLERLTAVCKAEGARLHHVKAHGALYWMMEKQSAIAEAILQAVRSYDPSLLVYCLSDGNVARAAAVLGLAAVHELFADRAYSANGTLVARTEPGAVIGDPDIAVRRILAWAESGRIETLNGVPLALRGHTICVHGDSASAFDTARRLNSALVESGWRIAAPNQSMP